jgi:hypothetical protein
MIENSERTNERERIESDKERERERDKKRMGIILARWFIGKK